MEALWTSWPSSSLCMIRAAAGGRAPSRQVCRPPTLLAFFPRQGRMAYHSRNLGNHHAHTTNSRRALDRRRRERPGRQVRRGAQGPQGSQDPPARPDLVRQPYSEADVEFMAGMIPHHAQAVLIAGWAASHGARPDIRVLCERMVVGQRDEIALMRNWLRDRGQAVPGRQRHAPPDEDERRRARHADAGHADARGTGRARQGARPRVGSAVPARHDQAPRGRHQDGRRALRRRTARCRTTTSTSSRRTCTPIRRPRSNACRRCSQAERVDPE